MTDIDWSKAPEGFPLWLEGIPLSQKVYSGWYRESGEVFLGERGGQWRAYREGQFFKVHRKPKDECEHSYGNSYGCPECGEEFHSAWNGEGLPPVGTDLEAGFACEEFDIWHKGTCVAVGEDPEGRQEFCVVQFGKVLAMYTTEGRRMRPIRTAEQIAAEEREKEIKAIKDASMGLYTSHGISWDAAEAIYNAGYRKVTS